MGVPKQRHTKSRRNKRRMHLYIKEQSLAKCPKCGQPVLPHTVCKGCGYYQGREMIDVMKKLTKKEKKQKERELAAKESAEKHEAKKEERLSWEGLSKK